MERVKAGFNTLLGSVLLACSALNLILYHSGYEYRPNDYIGFIVMYGIVTVTSSILSFRYKKKACKTAKFFGCIMPLFSLFYIRTLLLAVDFKIDNRTSNAFYYGVLFAITLTAGLVIFFAYISIRWVKIGVGCVTAVFSQFFLGLLLLSFLISNFGESTAVQTLNSPDNTYSAWVISSNQGALGGSTEIYVRNISKDIDLLGGVFRTETELVWSGGWSADPIMRWEDDTTLLVNNERLAVPIE